MEKDQLEKGKELEAKLRRANDDLTALTKWKDSKIKVYLRNDNGVQLQFKCSPTIIAIYEFELTQRINELQKEFNEL